MPSRRSARNILKDLHGAVSYTKITDVARQGAIGMGKAWSLRRSLLVCRHGRTVQKRPAVATCRPEPATGDKCPPPLLHWRRRRRVHNVVMRDAQDHGRAGQSQGLWLARQLQLSRGQWTRDEQAGAIRSAGWWESVTVTWSPAAPPEHPPPLLRRALAAAFDTTAPLIAEALAAGARRLLEHRPRGRMETAASRRRQLPTAARALPRSDQTP
jgi:hypothetical protein